MADPFDDFLDQQFSCDGNDALKQSLRDRTSRVLRQRRRMKWVAIAGLAAACYLAGLATMWLSPARTAANLEIVKAPDALVPSPSVPQPKPETPPVEVVALAERAAEYEWQAWVEPKDREANFLKAGNLYLEREQDYEAAVRCYTQAIELGGAAALEFSFNDNWLVMALKNAKRGE